MKAVKLEQTAKRLIGRRALLKAGLVTAGLGGLATVGKADTIGKAVTETMKTPGRGFSNYGLPSKFEGEAIRWIVADRSVANMGTSWTPLHVLEGGITPNGLHFERHHNGVPHLNPSEHKLLIHGLVDRPLSFNLEGLGRYPTVSKICFVECGGNSNGGWNPRPLNTKVGMLHGLVSCSEWSGVPLAVLLDEVGCRRKGLWLDAQGGDGGGFHVSVPVEKAFDDGILALWQNGERLRPENGYPMRLILPGWEAVTHVKWLNRLTVRDSAAMSRDETSQYTELGKDGTARQFTFVMQPKSVITIPSPGYTMRGGGTYRIGGLAWSGNGKIKRVEVSADGGESWAEALLDEPIRDKAFTRFNLLWRWDGEPCLLQSRAIDENGVRQPSRKKLLAERGAHGYFHYNAVVSWRVAADGTIRHVYAD